MKILHVHVTTVDEKNQLRDWTLKDIDINSIKFKNNTEVRDEPEKEKKPEVDPTPKKETKPKKSKK